MVTSKPLASSVLRTRALSIAFTNAAFMRWVSGSGNPAGARKPRKLDGTAYPGRVSPIVGMSGRARERLASTVPRTLKLPLRMCGNAVDSVANSTGICPARKSVMAGLPPRYGT